MIVRDRASGLAQVEHLKQFGGPNHGTAWEPTSDIVIRMVLRLNLAPKWILTDSATYYTSQKMLEFCSSSGLGLLTTPAESHEMLGAEEGLIRILKSTVERILKEERDLEVELAFHFAAHGHNQTIGPSGYSPFQWARGASVFHGEHSTWTRSQTFDFGRKLVWHLKSRVHGPGCTVRSLSRCSSLVSWLCFGEPR